MKRWGILTAIIAVLFGSVASFTSVSAQEQTGPVRRLQISPLHTFISIEPGASYAGSVVLKNPGTETLSVSLSAEAFTVTNEKYDYQFLPESPVNNWVRFINPEITIRPDQTYDAKFLISVPVEAEPGGAYISVFAASQPQESANIASVDRVGSLFYINLAGDTTEKGELLSFSAPWFHTSGTIPWSATVRNAGATHFDASYTVSVQTLWGSEISTSEDSHLILPRSVRLLSGSVDKPQWIGIYKLAYSTELGVSDRAESTQILIYAPFSQSIPLVALLLALSLFIAQGIKKHRNKNTA